METTTTRNQERSPSSYFCLSELPAFLNWNSFCENSETFSVLLFLLKLSIMQTEGQKNLSLFTIRHVRLMQTEEMAKLWNKMQVCVWEHIFYPREIKIESRAVCFSSQSFKLVLFHLPLQYSLRARPQRNSPNQSDSALCIYSKIRSDLERLLLENMEQSNSYSRTQNLKHTYEKQNISTTLDFCWCFCYCFADASATAIRSQTAFCNWLWTVSRTGSFQRSYCQLALFIELLHLA